MAGNETGCDTAKEAGSGFGIGHDVSSICAAKRAGVDGCHEPADETWHQGRLIANGFGNVSGKNRNHEGKGHVAGIIQEDECR